MTNLPDGLQTQLAQAETVVDQIGRVPIWYRQALYGALGPPQPLLAAIDFELRDSPRRPRLEQEQRDRGGIPVFRFDVVPYAKRTLGHLRRTMLAIRTVEYLFAWYSDAQVAREERRRYATIQHLLMLARRLYTGQPVDKGAFNGLRITMSDAYSDLDTLQLAAQGACSVAQYDGDLQLYPVSFVMSDVTLYAFRHDVAGFAALTSAARATPFWRWWLQDAIPAAWHAHPA